MLVGSTGDQPSRWWKEYYYFDSFGYANVIVAQLWQASQAKGYRSPSELRIFGLVGPSLSGGSRYSEI